MAYAESYWIVCYVEQTYGHETMLRMLDDCKNAEPQAVFFPKETHRSPTEFMADFTAWCEKQVDTWGYDKATTAKYNDLRKQGEAQIADKDFTAAAATWEQIAKLRPVPTSSPRPAWPASTSPSTITPTPSSTSSASSKWN